MDCRGARDKFVAYLEGDARLTERLCVDVHIAYCYECREELAEVKQLLEASKRGLRHPDPKYRFDELMARVRAEEHVAETACPVKRSLYRESLSKFAAAAIVLIVVGVSSPLLLWPRQPGVPETSVESKWEQEMDDLIGADPRFEDAAPTADPQGNSLDAIKELSPGPDAEGGAPGD